MAMLREDDGDLDFKICNAKGSPSKPDPQGAVDLEPEPLKQTTLQAPYLPPEGFSIGWRSLALKIANAAVRANMSRLRLILCPFCPIAPKTGLEIVWQGIHRTICRAPCTRSLFASQPVRGAVSIVRCPIDGGDTPVRRLERNPLFSARARGSRPRWRDRRGKKHWGLRASLANCRSWRIAAYVGSENRSVYFCRPP